MSKYVLSHVIVVRDFTAVQANWSIISIGRMPLSAKQTRENVVALDKIGQESSTIQMVFKYRTLKPGRASSVVKPQFAHSTFKLVQLSHFYS